MRREALENAMGRWAMTAPVAYEVTVRLSCFCDQGSLRPVIVRVRNGSVESRRYADTGAEVPASQAEWYPTVTRLFAFIFEADASHADHIRVTYDATFGYPASIYVDPNEGVADEESGYGLTDFHAIP